MDKNSIKLAVIPCNLIPIVWDKIETHIDLAIAESYGDLDKTKLYERLTNGQESALVAIEGKEIIATCLVTISTLDTGRKVLYVPSLGGNRMDEWLDQGLQFLRQMALDLGCDGIRACGRHGWAKVIPQAKVLHSIVEF